MTGYVKNIKNFIFNRIGLIPFIFSLVVCSKVLGFSLGPVDLIAYGLYALCAFILLFKRPVFDALSTIFLLYLPLTIILGDINPVFQPWPRYVSFALMFICTSPMLKSSVAINFRNKVFCAIVCLCALISMVSFVCYFVGINMMKNMVTGRTIDYLTSSAGTFGGITTQSMLLGPISGVGVIGCTYLAMKAKKLLFWVLACMCIGALLFTASRSSLIATIAGELYLILYMSNSRGKNLKRLALIVIIGVVSYPFWSGALDGINSKNQGNIQSGISTDSRESKWSIRIEEWEDSPLTGIGFVSVSDRDEYTREGVIEPGSSWLGVLSMTGSMGFILFTSIYIRAFLRCRRRKTPWNTMACAVLILVGTHMMAEGHVFAAGSFLCFLSWLAIGHATDSGSPYDKDLVSVG